MARRTTSTGLTRLLAIGAAFVAALGLLATAPAFADSQGMHHEMHHGAGEGPHHGGGHGRYHRGGITVEGEGRASVAPDMAIIEAGVVTIAKSARDAMTKNNTRMAAVMAAASAAGIAAKDLQTSTLRLWPRTEGQGGGDRLPVVVGYRAENRVRITARDLGSLGLLLDALVSAGANALEGPRFGIADPRAARDAARRKAMADAARRAALYAAEAGRTLGPVLRIVEDGSGTARPESRVMALAADSAPIASGELAFHARIKVRYALQP